MTYDKTICNFEGVKKVLKWILDEFYDNHNVVTLDNLYDKYGFGTGQVLFWLMTVKHSWVARGIDSKIVPTLPYKKIIQIYEDSEEADRPSMYSMVVAEVTKREEDKDE